MDYSQSLSMFCKKVAVRKMKGVLILPRITIFLHLLPSTEPASGRSLSCGRIQDRCIIGDGVIRQENVWV
jgi:hypothetical protein